MTKYRLKTFYKKMLADTITPVSIYLKLRDKFPNSLLLESSDYHGNENSFSYICCNVISSLTVEDEICTFKYPDGEISHKNITKETNVPALISDFINKFEIDENPFNFINNGLFGYTSYDAVRYFEDIEINKDQEDQRKIPDIKYSVYQYIIAINHFKNELYIFDHQYQPGTEENLEDSTGFIESLIQNKNFPTYKFKTIAEEKTNFTDNQFLEVLDNAKKHNHRGDVFQIVISRSFSQQFQGDEFNVYRSLRSINQSPYLFYFDYGTFKIFGSSPEAQIVIKDKKATIFPIAGTFRRTGNDQADKDLAEKLKEDPKENAEHVMLVDLARNDLSRNGNNVKVEVFKEIQFYSHVIHLVSKVTCEIDEDVTTMKVFADTFPAGTLSGAPKHKAMQLINNYEKGSRQFYGGCIGFIGFNGDLNQAIIIRSFLSKDNVLYYQAGAGVVSESVIESELKEVSNKLLALKSAIEMAKGI
jgi:anthranilate synthase component 1